MGVGLTSVRGVHMRHACIFQGERYRPRRSRPDRGGMRFESDDGTTSTRMSRAEIHAEFGTHTRSCTRR